VLVERIPRSYLRTVLRLGVNGCVFAYGQTGSGKSHTMFGDESTDLVLRPPSPPGPSGQAQAVHESSTGGVSEQAGLVPRCCAQLLEAIRRRRQLLGSEYTAVLNVSYVQVFGDEVTDLLYCPPPLSSDGEDAAAAAAAAAAAPPAMTLTAAHAVLSGALDRQVQ
jgi:hypothetical protein